jgi:hypothetical protein
MINEMEKIMEEQIRRGPGRPPKSSYFSPESAVEEGELVTYLPPPGDADVVKWRGVEFKAHVPVRITDKDHIDACRNNRFFRIGDQSGAAAPRGLPSDAMTYRGHVLDWMRDVQTIDQLARCWAADRDLRAECEIGYDDMQYLGTLIEPKLRDMRQSEGLNQVQVAEIWMKHGVLDLPWRA